MTQSQPGAREALQELVHYLRNGDWNLRSPQEMADMAAAFIERAISSPEVPASGPGTPAYRFDRLMDELQKRFPDPEPWSARAPEPRILAAIDKRLAEVPASTETQPVAWQERVQLSQTEWSDWYERKPMPRTAPRRIESGGVLYEFRPLYAAPPTEPQKDGLSSLGDSVSGGS